MYLPQPQSVSEQQALTKLAQPRIWQKGTVSCSLLVSASIYVLIARSLGLQTFGSYLLVQWLAIILVPLLGAGMSALTSRQLADIQSREAPRLVAGIFYFLWYRQHRSILLYCLVYSCLAFPLAHLFHAFSPSLLLLAGLSTLPLLLSNVVGTTLRSQRRSDLLAMLHLFGALLTLFFVIMATQIAGKPIEAFLLACALSSTLTLILAVICVIRLLPLEKALQPGIFLKEKLESTLNLSWLSFTVDAIVWQRSELLLLACWRRPADVGIYALSALISIGAIGLAPALYTHCLLPLILHYIPEQHSVNAYDAFVKTSCYILLLAVALCTTIIVFCPSIITYCLGGSYLAIVIPLRILLIAAVFGSIATVSLTHLAYSKQQNNQHTFDIGVALLKIGLVVPLIAFWGIAGAAIASALAQIASALIAILQCHNMLKCHSKSATGAEKC